MNNNIYLALDFPTWNESKKFLRQYQLQGIPVKVGMELFYREGACVVDQLKQAGHNVFLDLKLHDIPTTVRKAIKNLARLDIDMITIHALGGSSMMRAAKEGLQRVGQVHTQLLAVTMLTSMDQRIMNNELGISGNISEQVERLASQAKANGVDGVVCSVHEANHIKSVCGDSFRTVTPGVRLQNNDSDDQQRVATPAIARANGSDVIVVGRAVTNAADPKRAYQIIQQEWENEIKTRNNE